MGEKSGDDVAVESSYDMNGSALTEEAVRGSSPEPGQCAPVVPWTRSRPSCRRLIGLWHAGKDTGSIADLSNV